MRGYIPKGHLNHGIISKAVVVRPGLAVLEASAVFLDGGVGGLFAQK